jgi:hypothetical protein
MKDNNSGQQPVKVKEEDPYLESLSSSIKQGEERELFIEGKNWNIGQLIAALVYYSQIHTVKNVRPVEFPSHENTWRVVQQWLWDNCKRVNGEYVYPSNQSPREQELDWKSKYEKCITILKRVDAGIISFYDL